MATRDDYIDALAVLLPGPHPFNDADAAQNMAVSQGLASHSAFVPRVIVEDVTGDGGNMYPVSGLTAWDPLFSMIKKVEYPVDDAEGIADVMAYDSYGISDTPSGAFIRFAEAIPADETFRVHYTVAHAVSDTEDTIPAADVYAVQYLCAACYADLASAQYALSSAPVINADNVNHGSKRAEYIKIADHYRGKYREHFGIGAKGRRGPVNKVQNMNSLTHWGGDRATYLNVWR